MFAGQPKQNQPPSKPIFHKHSQQKKYQTIESQTPPHTTTTNHPPVEAITLQCDPRYGRPRQNRWLPDRLAEHRERRGGQLANAPAVRPAAQRWQRGRPRGYTGQPGPAEHQAQAVLQVGDTVLQMSCFIYCLTC